MSCLGDLQKNNFLTEVLKYSINVRKLNARYNHNLPLYNHNELIFYLKIKYICMYIFIYSI